MKELDAVNDKLFTLFSQDLKEPLGDILGSLDLISPISSVLEPQDKESLLLEMKLSTRKTLAIIENLMAWSRYQVAGLEIHKTALVVHDMVLSSASKLSYLWKPKELKVNIQIPDSLVLSMDPLLLSTILRNILSNAMKFTPRKGIITIKAGWKKDSRWILVEDQGTGLPDGEVQSLFKLRIAPPRLGTEGEQGTGFGLWLCKYLMHRVKGNILVKTSKSKGTSILLNFPEEELEDLEITED